MRSSGSAKAADGYLEAGSKKDDHISCILPIPPEYRNGKPLLLEIEWPDDKERMFSIYLYPEAGSKSEIRDRLGGGVAAGGIYPNSNRMQRLRYRIYGSTPTMLLELSTARIAAMLNNLERKGAITRARDKADRRRVVVRLTAQGREEVQTSYDAAVVCLAEVYRRMGEEDTRELLRLSDRAGEIAQQIYEEQKEGAPCGC